MVWVPQHGNTPGNCMANEPAREGILISTIKHSPDADLPFYIAKKTFAKEADSRWLSEITCNMIRQLWIKMDAKRSIHLQKKSAFYYHNSTLFFWTSRENNGFSAVGKSRKSLLNTTSVTVRLDNCAPQVPCETLLRLSRGANFNLNCLS